MSRARIRQLEAFHAVMQAGSATRAAELLRISQPAISKLIQELEVSTGLLLFERRRRRLHPTAEAQRFHRDVEQLFLKISHIEQVANEIRASGIGELKIAALPALGLSLIPRALASFRETHSNLKSVLAVVSSQRVVEMVAEGEVDVGFAYPVPGTGATLVRQTITSLPAIAALPLSHPLSAKEQLCTDDFVGIPLVSLGREDHSRDNMDLIFHEIGLNLNIVVETQFASVVCELVAAGVGAALVDPVTAYFFRERVALRPVMPTFMFDFGALTPLGKPKSSLVSDFIRTVAASIRCAEASTLAVHSPPKA